MVLEVVKSGGGDYKSLNLQGIILGGGGIYLHYVITFPLYFVVPHATFSLGLFIEPKFPKREKYIDALKRVVNQTHPYKILRIFERIKALYLTV